MKFLGRQHCNAVNKVSTNQVSLFSQEKWGGLLTGFPLLLCALPHCLLPFGSALLCSALFRERKELVEKLQFGAYVYYYCLHIGQHNY